MTEENKEKGKDAIIQVINICLELDKTKFDELDKVRKLISKLIEEGSDNIKDTKKYFEHLPLFKHLPLLNEILSTISDSSAKLSGARDKDEKIQELTELVKRVQADFENYRKQSEKHNEEIRKMSAKDVIMQILPVIDNLDLALKNVDESRNSSDFVQGIELIYSQLTGVLKDNNVEHIETEGQSFNPHFHEALMKVESELPENRIVEEFQKGFKLNGKVIRHAKVKVSSGRVSDKKEKEKKEDREDRK